MKIKPGYYLKKTSETDHLVPEREGVLDPQGVVVLNDAGAFLWQRLSEGCTEEAMVMALLQVYDIDMETACQDVVDFVDRVQDAGFLEK